MNEFEKDELKKNNVIFTNNNVNMNNMSASNASSNVGNAIPNVNNVSPNVSNTIPNVSNTIPNVSNTIPNVNNVSPNVNNVSPNVNNVSSNVNNASSNNNMNFGNSNLGSVGVNNNNNNTNNKSKKKIGTKSLVVIIVLSIIGFFAIILLVLFLIARYSVQSSIYNSRKRSVQASASYIASSFNRKYTESLILENENDVYGDVLGQGMGYDFSSPGVYEISKELADELNISKGTFELGNVNNSFNYNGIRNSFVIFDGSNFNVCLVVTYDSNYYLSSINEKQSVTINSKLYKFASYNNKGQENAMWACSDGSHSWE